jgi:acyl carrier protein
MHKTEIEIKVRNIIIGQAGYGDAAAINPTDKLISDKFGFDSLDMIELCMGIEEDFKIEIPDEDADRFKTVADIVSYINQRINNQPQNAPRWKEGEDHGFH